MNQIIKPIDGISHSFLQKEEENYDRVVPEYPSIVVHSGMGSYARFLKRCFENPEDHFFGMALEKIYNPAKKEYAGKRFYISGKESDLAFALTLKMDKTSTFRYSNWSDGLKKIYDHSDFVHEMVLESAENFKHPTCAYLDFEIDKVDDPLAVIPIDDGEEIMVNKCIAIYLKQLRTYLTDKFPEEMKLLAEQQPNNNLCKKGFNEATIVRLTRSRLGRFSWHIIFKDIIWKSSLDQNHFMLIELKPKLNLMAPFNSFKNRIVDFTVYSTFNSFRMWDSCDAVKVSDWNTVHHRISDGVTIHRLQLVSALPSYVQGNPVETLIWTSITMGITLEPNAKFNRSSEEQGEYRVSLKDIKNKSNYKKGNWNDALIMGIYNNMTRRMILKDFGNYLGGDKKLTDYWPTEYCSMQLKDKNINDIFRFNPRDPNMSKFNAFQFHFKIPEALGGTPCFREGLRYHKNSPVFFTIHGSGVISQGCFSHHHTVKTNFRVGSLVNYETIVQHNALKRRVITDESNKITNGQGNLIVAKKNGESNDEDNSKKNQNTIVVSNAKRRITQY